MFGTIRKHQTWLWAVIITLTVISFVIYFSPYSKMNNDRRNAVDYGAVNGVRVTDREFAQARREVELHYFFMSGGQWPDEEARNSRFDPMAETYKWLLLIQKQDQLGIHVGVDAVAEMARAMVSQFQRKGVTSPAVFIEKVLPSHRLEADDFERYVRHYIGVQELISTVALSGKLVTPDEAKALYEREHRELATEAVVFSATNHLSAVTVMPEALSQFYSNTLANYIVPERRQVRYVKFDLTNYLAQAEADLKTNLNQIVDANFERLGTNAALLFPEAKTPEAVKGLIRERVIREKATEAAARKARDFANTLLDMKPVLPQNLDNLAKSSGLPAGVSEPFSREDEPKGLKVSSDFTKTAFALTSEDPFAGPLLGQDGVYEIAMDKTLPRETPSLDQVREQVTNDYKHRQAVMLARQAGQTFYQTLTNGLAQGKTFEAICTEAKVKPLPLPPFSISTRELPEAEDLGSLDQLKQAAFGTPPGKASPLVATAEGGLTLFVKAKLPIDQAKLQADLASFTNLVRRRRQDDAFNQWFSKEAEKGLRNVPMLAKPQPQPPPSLGSGKAKS